MEPTTKLRSPEGAGILQPRTQVNIIHLTKAAQGVKVDPIAASHCPTRETRAAPTEESRDYCRWFLL